MPQLKPQEEEEYEYIDTGNALRRAVQRLQQQPKLSQRTIDTETTGAEAFVHRIKAG